MNEQMMTEMTAVAERLAAATETLDRVLSKLDAQQEALNAKVDRIVAAVEERTEPAANESGAKIQELQSQIAELEKSNDDLKAQAARLTRKTLSPLASAILAKNAGEEVARMEAGALDKALQALTIEQRIAVKAEMARVGYIE